MDARAIDATAAGGVTGDYGQQLGNGDAAHPDLADKPPRIAAEFAAEQ